MLRPGVRQMNLQQVRTQTGTRPSENSDTHGETRFRRFDAVPPRRLEWKGSTPPSMWGHVCGLRERRLGGWGGGIQVGTDSIWYFTVDFADDFGPGPTSSVNKLLMIQHVPVASLRFSTMKCFQTTVWIHFSQPRGTHSA